MNDNENNITFKRGNKMKIIVFYNNQKSNSSKNQN